MKITNINLFDVCRPKQWKTIPMREMTEEGYPVYGANGKIGYYSEYNHPEPTVMITCRGATCGTINISEPFSYITGNAMALDDLVTNRVDLSYLRYYLEYRKLYDVISGTAQPQITRVGLKKITLPLPPLPEQKRIASILDKADALRTKRKQAIAKLDELLQSVFLDMFGGPVTNENWERKPVSDLAAEKKGSIRTGPFGSQLLHSEFVDSGIAVLGIDNAVQNKFSWAERRFITTDKYKTLKRYRVYPGDVIITIMGTCGRCAIVPDDIPEGITTKHLCCITLNRKTCLPEYLKASFLMHPEVLKQLGVSAKGAVMPGLNMKIIKELKIPMAPLSQQRRYEQITRLIKEKIKRKSNQLVTLDTLFASLQQRAFKGEL